MRKRKKTTKLFCFSDTKNRKFPEKQALVSGTKKQKMPKKIGSIFNENWCAFTAP